MNPQPEVGDVFKVDTGTDVRFGVVVRLRLEDHNDAYDSFMLLKDFGANPVSVFSDPIHKYRETIVENGGSVTFLGINIKDALLNLLTELEKEHGTK